MTSAVPSMFLSDPSPIVAFSCHWVTKCLFWYLRGFTPPFLALPADVSHVVDIGTKQKLYCWCWNKTKYKRNVVVTGTKQKPFLWCCFFYRTHVQSLPFLVTKGSSPPIFFFGGGIFFGSFSKSVTFCSLEKKIGLVVTWICQSCYMDW